MAVILHDRLAGRGGMTHIFHCVDPGPMGGSAVVAEIERLVNALMRAGSPRIALDARIVGGAHLFGRGRDVGAEIAGVCEQYLLSERIPIVERRLGGHDARRIVFDCRTGDLQVTLPAVPPPDAERNTRPARDPEIF